jgi:hypothetical protein
LSNFYKTCTTNAQYCALYGLMKMEHTTFAHWPPPLLKNCNYPVFSNESTIHLRIIFDQFFE